MVWDNEKLIWDEGDTSEAHWGLQKKAMKAKAAALCQQGSNYDNNEELKIKAEKANRKNAKTASTFEISTMLLCS